MACDSVSTSSGICKFAQVVDIKQEAVYFLAFSSIIIAICMCVYLVICMSICPSLSVCVSVCSCVRISLQHRDMTDTLPAMFTEPIWERDKNNHCLALCKSQTCYHAWWLVISIPSVSKRELAVCVVAGDIVICLPFFFFNVNPFLWGFGWGFVTLFLHDLWPLRKPPV